MSILFAVLFLVGGASGPQPEKWIDFAQGRGTSLQMVERVAKKCGVRRTALGIMHGPMFYRRPDDAGGELSFRAADLTPRVRQCLRRNAPLLRKRYRDLIYLPGTL